MPVCAWACLLCWRQLVVFVRAQLLLLDERDEDVELAQGAQDADQRLEVLYLPVLHALYGGDGNTALVCQLACDMFCFRRTVFILAAILLQSSVSVSMYMLFNISDLIFVVANIIIKVHE